MCILLGVIDGNWAQWGAWSECSRTCGEGMHTKQRTCSNPAPKNGGKSCEGVSNESRKCLNRQCNAGMSFICDLGQVNLIP